nr:immunoglobulin heavy chain junction region [Macaca mulatta]MOX02420.1 immunoglobulin heavy chain junction region [Macaca mulatta]MOX06517.1 immunoglobulin heavy chain junction region [Macaca mulatta]
CANRPRSTDWYWRVYVW